MGRWEPNARERLQQAAMELFQERGYSRTTVEEIAALAGLTERTFFRYFADKREVLFSGTGDLQKLMGDAVAAAPEGAAPLAAVAAALDVVAAVLPPSRERARARRNVIAANAELQERERMKLTSLASAITDALRGRGVAEPAASLTAEAGIAVFKVAFECWIEDTEPRGLAEHIRASLDELKAVVAGKGTTSSTSRTTEARRPRPPRSRRTSE
ncbi:TetR family transcriptional regulator [Sorangium sp. So ce1000]|uniref:TetR/AcrR family transcriptional regulator n=1 Tax=Sorangium sp. So ce1000 TaxID=3133325 RepID=UPI003F621BA0